MGDFKTALARTLRWEGGYSNDPVDRGGETYRGISRRNFPEGAGWITIGNLRAAGLDLDANAQLQHDVEEFYRREFWNRVHGEALPDSVAAEVFDCAVNCGVGTAARFLQRAVGVKDDGAIGQDTLRATAGYIETRGIPALVADLKQQRRERYTRIAQNDPSQQRFLKGWLRRADEAVA